MIEGINLLISIFIGCIVFIYYTNALFKPRTKYLYANISIIVGYMMLYAISSFYQPTLNVIAFSIATFVLMYLCFKVTLKIFVQDMTCQEMQKARFLFMMSTQINGLRKL